jgi:hypothetical protein
MTAVDEGTLLLAGKDPTVSPLGRDVLRVLAEEPGPWTLDRLADRISGPGGRPFVFAAVARLEDAGWLPWGWIR